MTHDLLRNGGIPALACVASAMDDAPFLRCTFQVKYDGDKLHATFSLQHKIHVYQSEYTQLFNLIYDADNLLPTTTRCQTSTRDLSLEEGTHIAKNSRPDIRVLSRF
jgi:hypothetical protein